MEHGAHKPMSRPWFAPFHQPPPTPLAPPPFSRCLPPDMEVLFQRSRGVQPPVHARLLPITVRQLFQVAKQGVKMTKGATSVHDPWPQSHRRSAACSGHVALGLSVKAFAAKTLSLFLRKLFYSSLSPSGGVGKAVQKVSMATKLFPVLSILISFFHLRLQIFITFGWPIIFSSRCLQIVFTANHATETVVRSFSIPKLFAIKLIFWGGLFFFIIPFNPLSFRKTDFSFPLLVFWGFV